MTQSLIMAIESELAAAEAARAASNVGDAFHHLERAHILSQRVTWQHVRVHWRMLKLGAQVRDPREVAGQLTRVVAAALFSRVWVPVGNTGRSNVSALKPMPVPDDLRVILERNGV
jgi:hypothetical protein